MMRMFSFIALMVLLSVPIFGQSAATPAPATFEIADVHVSAPRTNPNVWVGPFRAGRYEIRNATMVDLIRTAYSVDAEKVIGGPSWLEVDRFDVIAKAPASTSADTVKLMLQGLLADRFKLVLHKDTTALTQFALTVAGKHKLKETAGSGNPGCQPQPQAPEPGVIPVQVAVCRGMTMAALAELLPRAAGAYVTSPVVDSTGLQGSWDFEIKWHARGLLAQAGTDGITIFDALEKQLGLKLESQKLPAATLVVDNVNQKPTENPPGIAAAFPPPPAPEFEVADVKPSPDGAPGPMARIQPTGQVNVSGMPLRMLIALAWDLNPESGLLDGPKWIESARFDIVARAFTSVGPTDQPPIDIDALRLMLRALLVERFKMKTHIEERQVSGYALVTANPKLTKADPASRTRCVEGPAPGARDPRNVNPINSRLITCQNMTMSALAARLQSLAPGYIRTPVADATGLEGGWNLTVNFSPVGVVGGGAGRGGDAGPAAGAGQPGGGALAASDPNGAITLLEALPRQLGLKLEMQSRSMPVLVIDHVEQKPTEN
jgi:uncharacterized protein (TIGR03435 family)